ncbi:hypothetical protein CRUP_034096 [Coryphaenoides rupestris]|nr:hypothetical protein CRUP_034096 [Coryphaenoides rupestris]
MTDTPVGTFHVMEMSVTAERSSTNRNSPDLDVDDIPAPGNSGYRLSMTTGSAIREPAEEPEQGGQRFSMTYSSLMEALSPGGRLPTLRVNTSGLCSLSSNRKACWPELSASSWAITTVGHQVQLASDYDAFCREFNLVFNHPAEGQDATGRLHSLQQGHRSVADYTLDVRILAADSGTNRNSPDLDVDDIPAPGNSGYRLSMTTGSAIREPAEEPEQGGQRFSMTYSSLMEALSPGGRLPTLRVEHVGASARISSNRKACWPELSASSWAITTVGHQVQLASDYDAFCREFNLVFNHPAEGQDATGRLHSLQQGHRSVADYTLDVRILAADSGWDDAALKSRIRIKPASPI